MSWREPRRAVDRWDVALLSALTVLPLVLGARGQVNADTKQYLYLDPIDLMARAQNLWDSRVGGGTVSHQAVGYLWPMGPYFALTDALGLPDWVSQRLWVGGIQLVAALGALALLRHLLPRHRLQLVPAAVYGLSPFVLGLVTTQSGLLLSYAALGWLVLVMARAVEEPHRWRWPAAFALLVTSCGSLNGTTVFFVVLAATLWVPLHLAGDRTTRLHDGARILGRTAGLTLVTQLWWLIAYSIGGAHGLPILSVTETVRTTNATSSAAEVLRGLGYWTFYGADIQGLWLGRLAVPYLTSGILLALSFAIPLLALTGLFVRWRYRTYFGLLVGLGILLSTGAFPTSNPSPLGDVFMTLSRHSEAVLSLRNTQRAGAIVALGLAGLVAAALDAVRAWRPRALPAASLAVLVLAMAALPAQWHTGLVAERGHRDEDLPAAWHDAANLMADGEGRILELPGSNFAAYRWGFTLDPVSVGLTHRSVLARELVPQGGEPGVLLLEALDRGLQEGWFEPASLAPIARLLGSSQILVRGDLDHERYKTIRPEVLWPLVEAAKSDLGTEHDIGVPYVNVAGPVLPMVDEIALGLPPNAEADLPQLALIDVPDGRRAPLWVDPGQAGTVVDGDGEGLVAAAAAGLLDDQGALLLGADVSASATRARDDIAEGTTRIVLTDTNRKQAHRWYALRENVGATEPADASVVLDDDSDARLPLTPDEPAGAYTVAEYRGAARIWATMYGQPATLLPEERPANAFDGDPTTAWRSERNDDGTPRRLGIELDQPVAADHVRLVPAIGRIDAVATTHARITLDGDPQRVIDVRAPAHDANDPKGIDVPLDGKPFQRFEIEAVDTEPYLGRAGWAEVQIPGVDVQEVIHLPKALVDRLGSRLGDQPVSIVLTRLRANPAEPARRDPEARMLRALDLPVPLTTGLTGTARLDPWAPDATLDHLLGAGPERWPAVVRTSARIPGSIASRGSALFDKDPTTAWQTPFNLVEGQWAEVATAKPVTLKTLTIDVVADAHHSHPTALTVQADGGAPQRVAIPALDDGPVGTTRHVEVALPKAISGRTVRVTISGVDARTTADWYTGFQVPMPVAIAEVAIPGLPTRPTAAVDTGCRKDLVTVGDTPVRVRITGTAADATAHGALKLLPCDGAVALPKGTTELTTAAGHDTGLDLDRLVLQTPTWASAHDTPLTAPRVHVTHRAAGDLAGEVTTDGKPVWIVADESIDDGWHLSVDGGDVVDGPRPVDGRAVGWYVQPDGAGRMSFHATWQPQRTARLAELLSLLGVLACMALLWWPRRGRRAAAAPTAVQFDRHLERGSWATVVTAPIVALLLATPAAALLALVVALAGRRWSLVARGAPLALMAVAALSVVVLQVHHRYPAAFGWPTHFLVAHQLVLVGAVLLLVAVRPPPAASGT